MTDQAWLEEYLRAAAAVAGTVHRRQGDGLRLTAAKNIPPKVCEVVNWVPSGKGMAGQALLTGKAVSTCNLKDDPSAAVRPGARAVDAQAAVALPIPGRDGMTVAVVGVAWPDSRDLPESEIERLTGLASGLVDVSE